MKLKEKFEKNVRYNENGIESEVCVLIADDFAVGFANWLQVDVIIDLIENYTTRELLQIYKKENGL